MARTGFFQYDRGKWGFVNKQGNVDFGAKAPGQGATVHNMNTIMPWLKRTGKDADMPKRRGYLDDWQDWQYKQGRDSLKHQLRMAQLPIKQQRSFNDSMFKRQSGDIRDSWQDNLMRMNASAAARGISSSGMQDRGAEKIGEEYQDNLFNLNQTYGGPAQSRLAAQLRELATGAQIDLKGLRRNARQAYENKIDAGEVKVPDKGYFKRNGIWHFRNRDGVEISLGPNDPRNAKRSGGRKSKQIRNRPRPDGSRRFT